MKLIYYLPVQLPCTVQGAWQFPAPLQLHDICPFTKLVETNRTWPCCQIQAMSGEMRVMELANEAEWITPCVWRPDLSALPRGFLSVGAENTFRRETALKPQPVAMVWHTILAQLLTPSPLPFFFITTPHLSLSTRLGILSKALSSWEMGRFHMLVSYCHSSSHTQRVQCHSTGWALSRAKCICWLKIGRAKATDQRRDTIWRMMNNLLSINTPTTMLEEEGAAKGKW